MATVEYRLLFNGKAATQRQLDLIESITVQQDVDMAWEAVFEIPVSTSDAGKWTEEDDRAFAVFARIRVEVRLGKDQFTPLIDGPIIGFENTMNAEPGRSLFRVRAQDDSALLNRKAVVDVFEGKTDDQIARQVFQSFPEIASLQIESVPASGGAVPAVQTQHETAMSLLRRLAKRQDMHAYVLPGASAGQSVGAFKKFPSSKDGLPDIVVLGKDRNASHLELKETSTKPGKTVGSQVSLATKKVTSKTSRFELLDLLGPEQGLPDGVEPATFLLPPQVVDSTSLDNAVQAETSTSSYQFEGTGSLITESYGKSVSPYRVVTVKGVNGRLSGDYLIAGVTHTLSRDLYKQDFRLMRNARSSGSTAVSGPREKVF
jgi:hypothetical protein